MRVAMSMVGIKRVRMFPDSEECDVSMRLSLGCGLRGTRSTPATRAGGPVVLFSHPL
jgi:hypothetical protein